MLSKRPYALQPGENAEDAMQAATAPDIEQADPVGEGGADDLT